MTTTEEESGATRSAFAASFSSAASGGHTGNSKRRSWDDEFVLERQFSALIPAFDPRPGRTNVNQTSDLEIPPPALPSASASATSIDIMAAAAAAATAAAAVAAATAAAAAATASSPGVVSSTSTTTEGGAEAAAATAVADESDRVPQPKLHLTLRGPSMPNVPDVEVDLTEGEWTVFRAVQKLIQSSALGNRSVTFSFDLFFYLFSNSYQSFSITYCFVNVGKRNCAVFGSRRTRSSTASSRKRRPALVPPVVTTIGNRRSQPAASPNGRRTLFARF